MEFEPVIGLEIHAQILTKTKAFSQEKAEYGDMPNTNISAISLAYPGTLPKHNKAAIEKAIKVGIALDSQIELNNKYARKNYFYADLPKGYQITQFDTPICVGGKVKIKLSDGTEKFIRLIRIHMEEDTGKSMHDMDLEYSLIDYNRVGTPLIEIVTEPDIKTGEEAYQFITEIRKLLRYLDVCDGNMEEGSLRCDANISVKLVGQKEFGVKVEVKNMNSMNNVKKAIEHEIERQIACIKNGEIIPSETRSYDALKNTTFGLRSKEMVNDYRYFPEPDLPPLSISNAYIETIKASMPMLPEAMFNKFKNQYQLPEYDAQILSETKEIASYFEAICLDTKNYKMAANWVITQVKGYLNENAIDISEFKLSPSKISEIINMIDDGKINHTVATKQIFPELIKNNDISPLQFATENNLIQSNDTSLIDELVQEVLAKYPEKVMEYKSGKKGILGLFMGEVMKKSGGKIDPKTISKTLEIELEK